VFLQELPGRDSLGDPREGHRAKEKKVNAHQQEVVSTMYTP